MLNKNRGIAVFSYLFVSLMMTFLLAACSPDKKEQITTSVASANTTSTHTDPAAGKSLSRACSKCHGDDGAKSLKGAPFIAGQQSEYLKTSIKAYADGHRS
jgi:cytochrome c553